MNHMNHLDQLFLDALPKVSLAFVTHRAEYGGVMTVCLEGEQKEAIVHWKKLNMVIQRGTLFQCQYKKVVQNGEHKFLVTEAIERMEVQPHYKISNIWNSVRLFGFMFFTSADNTVNAACVTTGYEARLIIDTNDLKESAFTLGEVLVGWARFEVRNNLMGAQWYLVEVEGTLDGWNEKQEAEETLVGGPN